MLKYFFNKDFFLLWLGQSVSRLGDGAGFIAVMWWVQSETGSAAALGTLAMVKGLAATLSGPFAGVLVDRMDRKMVIIGADLTRGVIYLVLGYTALMNTLTLPVLFVLSCAAMISGQFFHPAVNAAIPLLVSDDGLERANALNQMTNQIVRIGGYSAGGILVALFGVPVLLIGNGISYLLSALSEGFIVIPKMQKEMERFTVNLFTEDIKGALQYIRKNEVLVKIIGVAMVMNFVFAPLFVLLPIFVSDHMGAGSSVYGYLLSSMMVGGLLGSVVLSATQLVQNNLWIVKWGITVQGLVFLVLPFLPVHLWLSHAVVMIVSGCISTLVNVYFNSVLQRMVDQDYMGKLFSLLGTATGALQPAAQGLSGAAAEVVRLPVIFTVCSISLTATGTGFVMIPDIDAFLEGKSEKATSDSSASAVSSD